MLRETHTALAAVHGLTRVEKKLSINIFTVVVFATRTPAAAAEMVHAPVELHGPFDLDIELFKLRLDITCLLAN